MIQSGYIGQSQPEININQLRTAPLNVYCSYKAVGELQQLRRLSIAVNITLSIPVSALSMLTMLVARASLSQDCSTSNALNVVLTLEDHDLAMCGLVSSCTCAADPGECLPRWASQKRRFEMIRRW